MKKLKILGIFLLIVIALWAMNLIIISMDYEKSEPTKSTYELQRERLEEIKQTKTDVELTIAFHYCDMMGNTDHIRCLLDFLAERGRAGNHAVTCYNQFVLTGSHCISYTKTFGSEYPK